MRTSIVILLAILIAVQTTPAPAQGKKLPHIVILATGGTIAGSADSKTSVGYTSGAVTVDALIAAVPTLKDIARITGEQVSSIGSQDMCDSVWLKLAARANAVLAADTVDGVVITHGTDTMEETAYFLQLVVKSKKPVVLTGSMRPSTALSADGPLNIYNAVAIASDPAAAGRGVLVAANDDIHSARDITKMNTTDVQTFDSPEYGLVGTTLYGKQTFFRTAYRKHTVNSEFSVTDVKSLPRVDVLYANSDMSADLIDAAVKLGAKGIVIAGVGDGNMTTPALDALSRAVKAGVVCVRSSRLPSGRTWRNSEVNDDKMGFVAAGELNPSKSRILLKLALMKTKDAAQVQKYFEEY
ncbi:MAG: ansB [Bacteroidetes bacterium]|jgi:L-asparaginase|nr:ansB [Bacteroidota bacterium]